LPGNSSAPCRRPRRHSIGGAPLLKVKPGRYNALALTALEQSLMWIVKELTA
jgi:hypothetical protein